MKPTCIPSALTVLALASMSTHAAVNYIDYNAGAGTWAVDPAYSTAAAGTYYRAIEPAKSPGMPIGSYAARAGGGVDVIYTYGGFNKVDTGLTGNYQSFAFNITSSGYGPAFWGAKVGGGLDYLYESGGLYYKHAPASNITQTYTALSPSKANDTLALSAYGARAGGGIDFIFYDSGSDAAARVDTGLTGNYQALAFNDSTVGYDQANWAANVGGGLTYFYYLPGSQSWATLSLSDNLSGINYLALEGAKGSGLYAGTYGARADGGIDLIYLAGDGSLGDPYRAATYNVTPLVPGTVYSGGIAMDRSGIVPGDFFAATIPEPSTFGLLMLGGLGACAGIRRRSHRA